MTGHLHEQLERHPHLDISFVRNLHFDETNNVYSLALAFEQIDIDDDLLLLESDLIFEPAVMRRLIDVFSKLLRYYTQNFDNQCC